MRIATSVAILVLGCLRVPPAAAQEQFAVKQLRDPLTQRLIRWYQSPHHETHNYYFVSPWSSDEKLIVFFQFDQDVDKLTGRGSFPGSLWVMNADGSSRRKLVGGLRGGYHTGAGQFWGLDDESIYFASRDSGGAARVDVRTAEVHSITSPVPCRRASPDGKTLSCNSAEEWGVFNVEQGEYKRLVTLERALALTPNKRLAANRRSHLQNTRFGPSGNKVIIVHRTSELYPRLVEMFVYDLQRGQLSHLADDLHHPTWRPDGEAVLFVRRDPLTNKQSLWEVDLDTKQQRVVFDSEHVPAGHPSYHPRKPHLVVTDCYGGEFGYGIAVANLRTGTMTLLVSIPQGAGPEKAADERFPVRNWHIWFPARRYLNEPRPVWNKDGSKLMYTSEESGRMNLYEVDTSDL